MTAVSLPFARGETYPIRDLRAFAAELAAQRQAEPAFSGELRSNRLGWAKAWNEELLPVLLFVDQEGISDDGTFRLMPEGHATDVELVVQGQQIACQVTIADPSWADAGPAKSGGYLHHLQMECLREGRPAFGGGNTAKVDRKIVSSPHARDVAEDLAACRRSLAAAIRRKADHDGSRSMLLIYARGQRFLLVDFDMAALVGKAVRDVGATSFARIAVVDDKFLWGSR
jgi:hypothetical protein